ncbi:hypothetical protein V493_07562 [Pseudogymnoascus sp. VKM F-4281 (FW-2241)]|nr:hypothetical protein V493_07562 [Pseudogymnoascus sp. VKM F-4281 (FW-2241)]
MCFGHLHRSSARGGPIANGTDDMPPVRKVSSPQSLDSSEKLDKPEKAEKTKKEKPEKKKWNDDEYGDSVR